MDEVKRHVADFMVQSSPISDRTAERAADTLSSGAIGAGLVALITDLNVILEMLTLVVGLVAGIFALFFHYRRWRNERRKLAKEVAAQVVPEVERIVKADSEE